MAGRTTAGVCHPQSPDQVQGDRAAGAHDDPQVARQRGGWAAPQRHADRDAHRGGGQEQEEADQARLAEDLEVEGVRVAHADVDVAVWAQRKR